jgi:hypothetical protein
VRAGVVERLASLSARTACAFPWSIYRLSGASG